MRRLDFDLSGLPVSISSASSAIVDALESAWKPFLASAAGAATPRLLDVVVREDAARALDGAPISKDIQCTFEGSSLAVRSRDAVTSAHPDGRCELAVGIGTISAQFHAVLNALLPALAWRLPDLDGVLLHAAALAVDHRAFVLVGPSGAGKSTWAWSGRDQGAGFISDDVVAIRVIGGRPVVLSLPFRGNHPAPLPPARWELGAVLLPEWGETPRLEPVSALAAHVAIESSVLYRDVISRSDGVAPVIDAIAAVPARTFAFGRKAPFLATLREFV